MQRLMGSEIVTIELIDYFLGEGCSVLLATCALGDPVESRLPHDPNLSIVQFVIDDVDAVVDEFDPELAWIHHGLIPDVLVEKPGKTAFVFNHMSAQLDIEYAVQPFESVLSNVSLFNAQKVREAHLATGLYDDMSKDALQLFENPAPASFTGVGLQFEGQRGNKGSTPRIAVISNHIPDEVMDACADLEARGVAHITLMGNEREKGALPHNITPELLAEFDGVITIGKTVQYCLALGVDVYCYDHFGGPGWLTPDNVDSARYDNFSGRGFAQKSGETIALDIRERLASPVEGETDWGTALTAFSLPDRMAELFEFLKKRESSAPHKFDQSLLTSRSMRQRALASYVQEWVRLIGETNYLQSQLDEAQGKINRIKKFTGYGLFKKVLD
jgi:hypothetical protein